jgi:hypothetical protein
VAVAIAWRLLASGALYEDPGVDYFHGHHDPAREAKHLQRWIESATQSAWTCVHDPVCLAERGGCHKCLAVAFGCERFNKGLDRGYLVGGGPQDIREGYLYTAQQSVPLSSLAEE